MAKPNYAFAKRQRDLAKKQKKEEKKLRKASPGSEGAGNPGEPADDQGEAVAADGTVLPPGQENLAAEQANPAAGGSLGRQSGPA